MRRVTAVGIALTPLRPACARRAAAVGALVALAAVAGAVGLTRGRRARPPTYRTVAVERGDIEVLVTSTGTLSAVTTVQVGAQVSGLITELHADFNSVVRKGQLIARLDPAPLALAVRTAEAAVARDVADSMLKAFTLGQATPLHANGLLTDNDYVAARTAFAQADAGLQAARVALARAQQDLAYADIYAPMDGVVQERDVQAGQTVAAAYAAPQLFVIASDLRRMQILVQVDEADIGQIREGQRAAFTVAAYPGRVFRGTVAQVRLQSATAQNVVDYPVVVAVRNPDRALLPGMTATVRFEVARAAGVLKVANGALQFVAPASLRAQYAAAHPRAGALPAAGGRDVAALWYLDSAGSPAPAAVRTGLSDGQSTAIDGAGIAPGLRVIVGVASTDATPTAVASPFQSEQGPAGPPPGGPPPPGPGPGGR